MKICASCHEVSPGGLHCDACGGLLLLTSDAGAHDLPESVWKSQRHDYGARRGMIVRFLAIFAGFIVAASGARESVGYARPWSYAIALAALAGGVFTWWVIYVAAGRAVRVWVLRSGQVRRSKLAKALLAGALRR